MALTMHTSLGDVKLALLTKIAPKASQNFLALAASGKYDGTKFHRFVKSFMIQGGDTGKGGDSIWGGAFEDEFHLDARHVSKGTLSMANKGPNTNRSQFFITLSEDPLPHLDNVYTVFGRVIHGLDVLDAMNRLDTVPGKDKPVDPPVIKGFTIHANPFAESSETLSS